MRKISLLLLLPSILIFSFACSSPVNSNNTEEKSAVAPPKKNVIAIEAHAVKRRLHSLIGYKQTGCNASNGKGEKVLSKKLQSDTFLIKIASVQNCETQYSGNFKLSGDTLNLIIMQVPQIIKRKNGKTDTIYTSTECYCLYQFLFKIDRMNVSPKTVTLNGAKLRGEFKGL